MSKIFSRTKHINNKLFSQNLLQSPAHPSLLNRMALDHINDNLGIIRKRFDGDVAFFGQNGDYFLENSPSNFQPKTLFLCDILPQSLELQIKKIMSSERIIRKFQRINTLRLNQDEFEIEDQSTLNIIPLCCDEELWPFQKDQLQLILSNMHLHWVNDLTLVMQKNLESLEPDGLIIGSMLGADTLQELRIAYTLGENERYGGISSHVSPFVSITEMGNLITRLKFTMPTIFSDRKKFYFDGVLQLLQYLQQIGESEALLQVRPGTYRQTLEAMIAIYQHLFSENDKIYSTFECINFAGWKFHPDQQTAKPRGSAQFSLKEISTQIQDEGGQIYEEGELIEEDDEIDKQNKNNL